MSETVTSFHVKFDVSGRAIFAMKPSPVPLSAEPGSSYSGRNEETWRRLPYLLRGAIWKLNQVGDLFDWLSYSSRDNNSEDPCQRQALKIGVKVPGAPDNARGILATIERLDEVEGVLRRHFGIPRDVPLTHTQELHLVGPLKRREELVKSIETIYRVNVTDKSIVARGDNLARRLRLASTRIDRAVDGSGLFTIRVSPPPVALALVPATYDSRVHGDKIAGNPELSRIVARLVPLFRQVLIHYGNDDDSIRIELLMRRHDEGMSDKERALATMNLVDTSSAIIIEELGLPAEVQMRGLFTDLAATE
jgi:hypothetical protein